MKSKRKKLSKYISILCIVYKCLNLTLSISSSVDRVGLSAGMNIGGPQGIRAIISQPPVPDNSSLLTFPTISGKLLSYF